ncbi:hypothetical protein IPZ58_05310 [Streptomyces roseoverticillatus]|uniref:hypothetical protein n=1 Tax=Streptomyces roseoverticillatus TaxID=66429 RepID=UPI001F21A260|nr:hypothetical protein [Streptomyces roseoverticillatus]MCF3100993.1 hypothetical protein [Streptomyces roseoverticillatus]
MTTYTRDQVSAAINGGADLVTDELVDAERDVDLINLVVNAALSILDTPEISLNDVMERNYEGGAEEVRSWWGVWS